MRKLICAILTLSLLLAIYVPAAFASHHGGSSGHGRHSSSHHTTDHKPAAAAKTTCGSRRADVTCGAGMCRNTAQCDPENCKFTDEDKDGLCDTCSGVSSSQKGGDRDGDGKCDVCGKTCGVSCSATNHHR